MLRISGIGFRIPGLGFRNPGLGFRIPGLGFRIPGLGFRILGLGFGFRVRVFVFGVSGLGFWGFWLWGAPRPVRPVWPNVQPPLVPRCPAGVGFQGSGFRSQGSEFTA